MIIDKKKNSTIIRWVYFYMYPMEHFRPHKIASIFLVLSWSFVIIPSGLWWARGRRTDKGVTWPLSWQRFLEDTGFGGNGGGYWGPPKKQLIMRISDLECFLDEYFSSFIFNSYVDTFLHDLNRWWSDKFYCLLRKGKFSEKNASQTYINSFVGGWVHKIFPRLQENMKGFLSFPSFLKFRSLAWPK